MFKARLTQTSMQARLCLHGAISEAGALGDAMLYATGGGKGLRGFLVMESARLYDVPDTRSVWAAASIEALHAYSLVHDDLPCMDDDDLRRGVPTVHKKWDEATAVLVGDALQSLAFELLAHEDLGDARVALIGSLAKAAGQQGMVHGQALDIAAETASTLLGLDEITELQAGKTGALIQWSAGAGALLAGENPELMHDYASALGLAFQIADDVLDVEGDAQSVGKAVGKDAKAGKATFVSLLGLTGAKSQAQDLVAQACDVLEPFGADADVLRDAARFVIQRDK